MSTRALYIGLMSGTSVDAVDAVLVDLASPALSLVAAHSHPIADELRGAILKLCSGDAAGLPALGETHIALGEVFADASLSLLKLADIAAEEVVAIGSHGQTIWHEPNGDKPFTLQIGDANTLAELTRITTVSDFRSRDMAAGGQGAPLAPLLHQHLFTSARTSRAIINIGGISNITFLNPATPPFAFDSGPGNVLMDGWIAQHRGRKFDENGSWASEGVVHRALLAKLQQDAYFSKGRPKSTGRELFNSAWLETKLESLDEAVEPVDVQATLAQLTIQSLVKALHEHGDPVEIYVCGGGAHNRTLMEGLANALPTRTVGTTEALGMHPDWVEAIAFAWLAKQTLDGRAMDTSGFTGARTPVVLGAIYQR